MRYIKQLLLLCIQYVVVCLVRSQSQLYAISPLNLTFAINVMPLQLNSITTITPIYICHFKNVVLWFCHKETLQIF